MVEESNLSVLQIAAESDTCLKLHLNGSETIVPVKNLLKINSNEEEISDTASYHILRHCALSTLFKFMPNQEIPDFAWSSFATHIYYLDDNKSQARISTDEELTNVLKRVCIESMMDDNDGVVLKVGCKIVHNYRCQEIQKLREVASVAADNAFRTMKMWLQGTRNFLDSKRSEFNSKMKSCDDYVMVHGDDDTKEEDSSHNTIHWASRFVQFFLAPETMYTLPQDTSTCRRSNCNRGSSSKIAWDGNDVFDELVQNAVHTASSMILEGFTRASDLVNEAIKHQTKNSRKKLKLDFSIHNLSRTSSLASNRSSLSSGFKGVGKCEDDVIINQDVEIVFDEKDKNAAEWKIFFGEEEEKNDEDICMIDEPDEVISMGSLSKESSSGKDFLSIISSTSNTDNDSSSFEKVSNNDDGSDSGSWAMLDEE